MSVFLRVRGSSFEDGLSIVLQFIDGFLDVIQGTMSLFLLWDGLELCWIPSSREFLDGRDIHDSVVQMLNDGVHLPFQKDLVCVHTVTSQDAATGLWDMFLNERQHLIAGFGCSDGGRDDSCCQARLVGQRKWKGN